MILDGEGDAEAEATVLQQVLRRIGGAGWRSRPPSTSADPDGSGIRPRPRPVS